ncbi:MAG: DUF4079 domain-containing protein [Desulfovibrionaceae bacterium]
MLWIHPVIQVLATLLALAALRLGFKRFTALHLGGRALFPWRTHVRLGLAAVSLWLMGFVGGSMLARWLFGQGFATSHGRLALVMLPLILIGAGTGLFMHRNRARRRALPLVHAAANLAALACAAALTVSGSTLVQANLLG